MARRMVPVALALAVAAVWAPAAGAVTRTIGPSTLALTGDGRGCGGPVSNCADTFSQRLDSDGAQLVAPGDGVITVWRAAIGPNQTCSGGTVTHALRVLRPAGNGFTGAGTRAATLTPNGVRETSLTVPLPIQAGDRIGVTMRATGCSGAALADIDVASAPLASIDVVHGTVADDTSDTPDTMIDGRQMMLNADVVLDAPVVGGSNPGSGPTTGGQSVTISGDHLTGTSQVLFGGVPATGVTVLSDSQVTAVTPAHSAGPVDITITAAGGTSSAAGAYTYAVVTGGGGGPKPDLSSLVISPFAFVAANSGPSVVPSAKVGTTVVYKLSEPARVTFRVQRKQRGIRRGRRCVKPPKLRPRHARRCTRYTKVRGSFGQDGVAGLNSFRFMGRLRGRALRPGNYRLVATAVTAAGASKPRRASFRIVR